LKVYIIAHKYCAATIESRAKAIAIRLASVDDIRSHISPTLTAFQIHDIALLVGCKEIVEVSRSLIIEDTMSGKIYPFDALALGDRLNDPGIIASAYYCIL
jgi:hypothetical protein